MLNGSRPYVTVTPRLTKESFSFLPFLFLSREESLFKSHELGGGGGREGGRGTLWSVLPFSPSASHSTADCLENQEGIYSGMVTPLSPPLVSQGLDNFPEKKAKKRKSENIWWKEEGFGTRQGKKVSAPPPYWT